MPWRLRGLPCPHRKACRDPHEPGKYYHLWQDHKMPLHEGLTITNNQARNETKITCERFGWVVVTCSIFNILLWKLRPCRRIILQDCCLDHKSNYCSSLQLLRDGIVPQIRSFFEHCSKSRLLNNVQKTPLLVRVGFTNNVPLPLHCFLHLHCIVFWLNFFLIC